MWNREKKGLGAGIFATGSEEVRPRKDTCVLCKKPYELDVCESFLKLSLPERRNTVQTKDLCRGCLKWGHLHRECRKKKSCKTRNDMHYSPLHDNSAKQTYQALHENRTTISNRVEVCNMKGHRSCGTHSLIIPVWLHHEDTPGNTIMVYALLDDQSDACFIKETTLNKLNVNGPEVSLKLSTVLAQDTM